MIESPGGFLPGITPDNILGKHASRNRRIAETFERCGLVERSGQGVRVMFEESIKESKLPPDYSGTDDYRVQLALWGEVQDDDFIKFLEEVGTETQQSFATEDFLILDLIRREQPLPKALRERIPRLRGLGVIETTGYGKGTRHILSRRYYGLVGRKGTYTRELGLDRETNKELLLKHINDNRDEGSRLGELMQVLPSLSKGKVQYLLGELKAEGRIHVLGRTRAGRWYAGPDAEGIA